MSHVRVYSRAGCHLCDDALAVVQATVSTADTVEVVDIDADPVLRDRYTIRVPVIEVDGQEIAEYQLNAADLRRALTS